MASMLATGAGIFLPLRGPSGRGRDSMREDTATAISWLQM